MIPSGTGREGFTEEMAFELSIEVHLGEKAYVCALLLLEGEAPISLALPSPRV